MSKQTITWIGHGSWKFETSKGTVIYIDPWIVDNPACTMKIEETNDADIVCVTHGHDDHLGDSIGICKNTGAVLVTLPDVAAYAALHGIPYDDRNGAIQVGGSVRQSDCVIRAVNALHYSDIWGEEYKKTGIVTAGCGCCGMIIEPDEGESVYFAGDTGLFGDMELIGKLYKPYVSVLPIGDKYVMGINEASYAAQMLGSRYIIPGHYNTFPVIKADTDTFTNLVSVRAPHSEVIALKPNEKFSF
ncbi:MAG: metal-dependent hydrolase [Acetivibrionales bacterium]